MKSVLLSQAEISWSGFGLEWKAKPDQVLVRDSENPIKDV